MRVFNNELKGIETGVNAKDIVLKEDPFKLSDFKGRVIWLIFWKFMGGGSCRRKCHLEEI
jgi:hypothetical protein